MDLSLLNARQQEAVRETEGYVRVIAGAGSGKTKLLVSRYAYLVTEYGIDSKNILCVTFTNKAAGEMKRRIRALIGPGYDTTLICTYHGFCNRLIREDSEKLFLPKEFQIIDSTQQKSMMSEIFRKYELKLDYASYENVLKQIAIVKEMGEYVPRMCTPEKCHILERIESLDDQIVEDFLQKQKATYTLDFNDLLQYALYLLNKDEDVRIKWQKRLNYIQVDEYQDSAKTEMRLIDILSDYYKNLMIVGDPDQNIYEWRGSDVKLLVDFDQGHPDTKTVILNQNYRSTPQILTCANTLIENNQIRLKKDLFTENPAGIPVYHYHSKSDFEETDSIVDQIRKVRRQENLRFSDFAILYRSGFLSRVIEKKLVEKSIPYEIYGGVKFYQRMEILDILAYLKLIAYDDDVSFRRIVNTPHRRFGREKMNLLSWHQEIEETESGKHVSLLNTLKTNLNETKFKESDVQIFIRLIESFRREKTGIRISELVNRVAAESGYEEYIRSLGDEERLDNLAEFKRIANDFEQEFGEDLTLEQFLEQIALQAGEDREEETDAVKLMTIHASKGLEFPVVFLVGLSEGVFPSSKTIEERKDEGLEEERRLCYVAITRARERLYLMDSEGATKNGTPKIRSRFLDEIGDENYVRIGKISKDLQDLSRKSVGGNENRRLPHTPNDMLKVGDTVQHHAFGQGKIIGLDKTRKSYQIQFDKLNSPRTITSDYFRKEHTEMPQKEQESEVDEPVTISAESAASENEIEERKLPPLQAVSNDETNLWKRPDVPHSGWACEGVSDLGAPVGTCEMCGHQIIRYAHHMSHPRYHSIVAGCICAGKMEGDIEHAKQRESEFKSRMRKQERIKTGRWKVSRNGNEYQEIDGHLVILFQSVKNGWKCAVDGAFSGKTYNSREDAINAALEKLG